MLTTASALGGRLEIDLPNATVNLIIGTSKNVEVVSESPITLVKMFLNRGRIVRWVNNTTQKSARKNSVSNTGAACASGGGIANTGIMDGWDNDAATSVANTGIMRREVSVTSNNDVVTIKVPATVTKVTIMSAANYTAASDISPIVDDKR